MAVPEEAEASNEGSGDVRENEDPSHGEHLRWSTEWHARQGGERPIYMRDSTLTIVDRRTSKVLTRKTFQALYPTCGEKVMAYGGSASVGGFADQHEIDQWLSKQAHGTNAIDDGTTWKPLQ